MNLGKLSPENEKFLAHYKKLGYATKTEMANDALQNLKKLKESELRGKWRTQGHKEYLKILPTNFWEDIDGDEFA